MKILTDKYILLDFFTEDTVRYGKKFCPDIHYYEVKIESKIHKLYLLKGEYLQLIEDLPGYFTPERYLKTLISPSIRRS